MPNFKIADEQTRVLALLLEELTDRDRDVLKWEHLDANCYITRVGTQEFFATNGMKGSKSVLIICASGATIIACQT